MADTYAVLRETFESSSFLHSVGSGDVQSVNLVLDRSVDMDEDDRLLVVAGAVMATAMVGWHEAYGAAERLLDPTEYAVCVWCGEELRMDRESPEWGANVIEDDDDEPWHNECWREMREHNLG